MLNIQEPKYQASSQKSTWLNHPFFDLLFRSHFVLATALSIVALTLWMAALQGLFTFNSEGLSPLLWHIHEMLFGFATTIAVGFILTAVQTWTGQPSVKGKTAILLVMIWLIAHTLMIINSAQSLVVATALFAIWWLLVITFYSNIVLKANNRRNYLFIPILTVMATLNLFILILAQMGDVATALHLSKSMLLVFTLLVSIIAGRVIPFFTVNGAKTQPISNSQLIEKPLLLTSVMGILVYVTGYFIELAITPAPLMLLSATLHLLRLSRWRSIKTGSVPLLWSLHLAYLFMIIGLALWGLSYCLWLPELNASAGIHMITIGTLGLMILAMMSRVSLGHTGRMLTPKPIISFAFISLALAAILRSILPIFNFTTFAWYSSALLWLLASVIFLTVYWPILCRAKLTR